MNKPENEKPFYLGDPKASQSEIDFVTKDTIPVTPEEMMDIARGVNQVYKHYMEILRPKMTLDRARSTRELRKRNSWRVVAQAAYLEWGSECRLVAAVQSDCRHCSL